MVVKIKRRRSEWKGIEDNRTLDYLRPVDEDVDEDIDEDEDEDEVFSEYV